jgi:glycosyltransferase involved in cell wall biosynthesis
MGGDGSPADGIEAKTISGAFLSIYPSTWAHDSAINDYHADPARTQIVEWGSNITATGATPRALPDGEVRLLFVGIEFDRKGGPLAIAVVRELAARGIACRLDIVGVGAEAVTTAVPDNVTFHGFVSKANPEGRALIDRLFAEASFFLLPTTAECFGIVFAEAASRGLPSISFATGGVPSAVLSGTTGILLPLGSNAKAFADAIGEIVASPDRYATMSAAALNDAHTRLDWDVWARRVEANVRRQLEIEEKVRP